MTNTNKCYLNLDSQRKTLYLSSTFCHGTDVSFEDAFTLLNYYGYRIKEGEENIVNNLIQEMDKYPDIADYGYTVVLSEEYYLSKGMDECVKEITDRSKKKGFFPDYVLLRKKGHLSLIHQSNDFSSLKNKPFKPSKERIEDGGGSFSLGLYVLDASQNQYLVGKPNWYTGHYEGYYYECIDDIGNGHKCGGIILSQKEYFIPRNVETIVWDE